MSSLIKGPLPNLLYLRNPSGFWGFTTLCYCKLLTYFSMFTSQVLLLEFLFCLHQISYVQVRISISPEFLDLSLLYQFLLNVRNSYLKTKSIFVTFRFVNIMSLPYLIQATVVDFLNLTSKYSKLDLHQSFTVGNI